MSLTYFEGTYIVISVLRTYIIYRFMHVFYYERRGQAWTEWLGFVSFYLIVTTVYLCSGNPVWFLLVNLCGLWGLGFLFRTGSRIQFFSALLIYVILMSVETTIEVLTSLVEMGMFEQDDYSIIRGLVFVQICTFFVELFCEKCKSLKCEMGLPLSHGIAMIVLPITSIYIIISLLRFSELGFSYVMSTIGLLILCNVCVFYLIEAIANREKSQYLIQKKEVESIKKQMEVLQTSTEKIREIRHDLKNHLHTIKSLNINNKKEEIQQYVDDLLEKGDLVETYIDTGNMTADGIINLKFMEARQLKIKITHEIRMPIGIMVSPYDWTVILGNLLDNAIEANEKIQSDSRCLEVKISYSKGTLLIRIANAYNGELKFTDDRRYLRTTKRDYELHGLGLANVREAVKRYDGELVVQQDNDMFAVEVIMFVS